MRVAAGVEMRWSWVWKEPVGEAGEGRAEEARAREEERRVEGLFVRSEEGVVGLLRGDETGLFRKERTARVFRLMPEFRLTPEWKGPLETWARGVAAGEAAAPGAGGLLFGDGN